MSEYLERFRADGKVAVVTGASSGLGLGFARAIGLVGASVVVAARRGDRLDELCAALRSDGITAHPVVMDVTDPEQCTALAAAAVDRFGSLDILVNNAGLGGTVPSHKEPPEHFRAVVDVNLMGTYWMAQAAAPVMRPGSVIVNIASLHGVTASRFPQAAYSASKAGVLGLTRDLASQWSTRRGIRVNALCPGYVETEMTSGGIDALSAMVEQNSILGRLGRQDEMDSALIFLATDASSYMTGGSLVVDGGYSVV
ncbi:SDR family NAD(P)-dependent oxidoreductase [Trujillonella endophytica]|uniref:NAD(P)-dependent dehydrogenase, short-chain alcohol dehydrogenase family n=1 Tax=Trujillonella endophytica TaxID=673521 RepID=A0A1H8QSH8_9ACTN|nr:SDR family oxidoreductase [Trujillella endophytica]SEO56783.1 NAD(P)-dependent dehydrogenase, short-chain alcohol dehydrogenase family [Trujillella endophytica]